MLNDKKNTFSGDDLKAMRLWSKKTTQQMADLVGIHRHTYENYEKEVSKIPLDYFIVWTRLSGVSLNSLFQQVRLLRSSVSEKQIFRAPKKGKKHEEYE